VSEQVWASYSQLTSHRTCPQKWMYGYERRLEKVDPEDIAVERDFGSWWQLLRAVDSIERGRKLDSLKWLPTELTATDGVSMIAHTARCDEVFAMANDWWRQQTPHTWETWAERLGEAMPDRLAALDQRWRDQWATEIETERPLAVELGWGRNLPTMPGPDNTSVDPNCRLVGYVDEVYEDTKRHLVVVRDNKTSKGLGTQSVADDMMDSQLQFYAWGASPTVTSWGVGPIRATAYDRIKTTKPKTPVVTQAGSLGKSVTDFDLATYVEWSRGTDGNGVSYPGRFKDGSGAGRYVAEPAVIERLSSPSSVSAWYQRTLTPLNNNLIKVHLRAAVDSAVDLRQSRARVAFANEAARNLTSGCRWCDFAGLCRAEMVGGPDGEYELSDYRLRVRPARQ